MQFSLSYKIMNNEQAYQFLTHKKIVWINPFFFNRTKRHFDSEIAIVAVSFGIIQRAPAWSCVGQVFDEVG